MRRHSLFSFVIAALFALSLWTPQALAQPASINGPGCTAGSASIGDAYFPTAGNGGYDVQHYDIDLELDVAEPEILAATVVIDALA